MNNRNDLVKSQPVRLFDVLVLGPFMIWAGSTHKNKAARWGLILGGGGTMVYNWLNYLKVKKKESQ